MVCNGNLTQNLPCAVLTIIPQNCSTETRTLKALLSSSSIYYTGITAHPIKKAQGEFQLGPGESKNYLKVLKSCVTLNSIFTEDTLALTIFPTDYMGKLVDYCMMKIYGLIKVKETNQTWSEEDDFVLEKPKLQVEVRFISNKYFFKHKRGIEN